jgi:hypothetical protein
MMTAIPAATQVSGKSPQISHPHMIASGRATYSKGATVAASASLYAWDIE